MKLSQNIDLKPYTSMYVGGRAKYFIEVKSEAEIIKAIQFAKNSNLPIFVLGGGSNVLVSDSGFNGVVIRVKNKGIKIIKETKSCVDYTVCAGEKWDNFVNHSIVRGLYGVENMSHIPGTVGASVVQNIGSYGQEVASSVLCVKAIDIKSLKRIKLSKKNLHFCYRKSCFNDPKQLKGKYIVTYVNFRLSKKKKLNLKYNDIIKYFEKNINVKPNLRNVRKAIIEIRDSKFPFPNDPENGTVGSFWNIDVINSEKYEKIIQKLNKMGFIDKATEMIKKKSVFRVSQGYKLAPGLFVEILGFKNKHIGGAMILKTHAGIINNFTGKATAKDVLELSTEITNAVKEKFGIKMKIEPELIGDHN